MNVRDLLPAGWESLFRETGRIGGGIDIATTTKNKSNPSALALTQEIPDGFAARLVVRFKTDDPAVTEWLIREVSRRLESRLAGVRLRRLNADATSERFFVAGLKKSLGGKMIITGVVNSESIVVRGERMSYKAFLGNLLVNTMHDGRLLLPNEKWLEKDLRQNKRANGSFECDVDESGNHGDAFDAIKLSLHALWSGDGGPTQAAAAAVGSGAAVRDTSWIKNPLARALVERVRPWRFF